MADIRITEETEPAPATVAVIGDGLAFYNEVQVGPDPSNPVWIIARDDAGDVCGGLKGITLWTWFLVDWLWVAEDHRQRGLGTRLLAAGEQAARDRGCIRAFLNSFSFQAPAFYRRRGYEEFGRLEDFPPGHERHWFRKDL